MTEIEIKNIIRRRRAQMIVHSYLYYEMDTNIISDDLWQQWANELEQIQKANPKCCKIGYYDRDFFDWDGTTGNHLPKTIIVEQKAKQVLKAYEMFKDKT